LAWRGQRGIILPEQWVRRWEVPHLGVPELLIILLIIIIVFGVGKLPELGGALGRSIREFRKATSGLDEEEKEKEKKD
jgi:sec-independent protein translocase protein TatA